MLRVKYDYKERDYAKHLDAKTIRKALKTAVTIEGKIVQSEYKKIQAQYKNKENIVQVRRRIGSGTSPDGKTGTIYSTVGLDKQYCVLVFLEDGTKVRYRNVSHNWKSRTKPGSLQFGTGRGFATDFGYNPGIKARNFRDAIIDKRYPEFTRIAIDAFNDIFRYANWV